MSCVGSRYDEGGIFCNEKGAMGVTKNFELLAFRDFLKRLLLPALGKGRDTQCGFKAFKASVVKKVIPSVTDRKFSFDMQLLMLVALQCGGEAAMGSEAVVYVDSLAESNFYQQAPGVDPMLESYKSYFNMMGRMLALHDTFKDKQEVPAANQPVIDFVRGLTLETFSKMMATMPRMQGKPDWGRVFTLPELQSWKSGVVLNAANYSNVTDPVSGEPLALDLTDAAALDRVYAAADRLLQTYPTVDALQAVEAALLERQRELPTMIHLAVKLAKSKALMAVCPPVFVTMITAMYNEKNRMCSKDEHPNGENFLVNKSREMEWLFEAAPQSGYELIYVDDGCPKESGKLATERIKSKGIPHSKVLYLQDGIDQKEPNFDDIKDTKDSQKGGAVEYGMWMRAKESHPGQEHIIVFTDADLAANLSQTGLLCHNLTSSPSRMSCVGSRYDEGGIFCNEKGAMGVTKNFELLAFRDFLKRLLLPALGKGRDTQCGFKAFKASVVKKVIPSVTDRKFSFDMQLLMLVALQCGGEAAMGSEAVVYVDSLAESNFYQQAPGVDPMLESYKSYFNMMGRMLALHDTFKDKQEVPAANQPVIDFVRGLTLETFSKMMATMPRMQGKPDWGRVFTLPELKGWAA